MGYAAARAGKARSNAECTRDTKTRKPVDEIIYETGKNYYCYIPDRFTHCFCHEGIVSYRVII